MTTLPYPQPSDRSVSERMMRNRRRDTVPELAVRASLHARGLRFRIDHPIRLSGLTVRPDVVFTRWRVAVFVDGCFWHRCPDHGNLPQRNTEYWTPKLERNVQRDKRVDAALHDSGWLVVRAWEHELPEIVADRTTDVLAQRRETATAGIRSVQCPD